MQSNPDLLSPIPDLAIHCLYGPYTSYALVRRGRSILIECHSDQMPQTFALRNIPSPDLILHTHVQPHHCREGDSFPNAKIMVSADLADLAADNDNYKRDVKTSWDHPEDWMNTFGRERYGLAGSVTLLPPRPPLKVGATFKPGDVIPWLDLQLRVVPLPLHGFYSIGFILEEAVSAKPIAAFIGDLFRSPACFDTIHDMETNYAGTLLLEAPRILREVADWGVDLFLPSTGPAIPDGSHQARLLAEKVEAYFGAVQWSSGKFSSATKVEYPTVGRYINVLPGVYQINNFGNCILFIDDQGRGMLVDPGPCDYESPDRWAKFIADLELFERTCGLKTIDLALITHIHGDHFDMTPDLLKRYPGCRVAAWDLVARVIESPWDYPYPALLPWYGLWFDAQKVDDVLVTGQPYYWHDLRIDSNHLPGHCWAHGVYFFTWKGTRIAITGDTIQSRGAPDGLFFSIANDSIPDDPGGCLAAYRLMTRHEIDLNLGGHGSNFIDANELYAESVRKMEHALPWLRAIIHHGDLPRAFRRSWYPTLKPLA